MSSRVNDRTLTLKKEGAHCVRGLHDHMALGVDEADNVFRAARPRYCDRIKHSLRLRSLTSVRARESITSENHFRPADQVHTKSRAIVLSGSKKPTGSKFWLRTKPTLRSPRRVGQPHGD